MKNERAVRFFGDIVKPTRIHEILRTPSKREVNDICNEILKEYGVYYKHVKISGEMFISD